MTDEERQALKERISARKAYWGIPDNRPLDPLSKQEWLNAYKEEHGCLLCGTKDRIVLDFHHVDSKEKEGDISKLAGYKAGGWERLQKEVAKCVVLCSNCHRRVHRGRLTEKELQKLVMAGVPSIQMLDVLRITSKSQRLDPPPKSHQRSAKHSAYWYECLREPIHWEETVTP
jgi:hypothetical protein